MTPSEIYVNMTFDAGHRIVGHEGKCARLHGHTYRAEIRAVGPIRGIGFVVDFGDIKEIVNQWDHMMLLWNEDPLFVETGVENIGGIYNELEMRMSNDMRAGVVRLPFNPTAENMAQYLAEAILHECDLLSISITLWETPNASAMAIIEKDSVMVK